MLNAACSRCHGRDGKGARGPDLTTGQFRHAKTDEELLRVISNGINGTDMPGMGPYDDIIWPIIAYLRAESKRNPGTQQPPTGDQARGYELFKQHKCASCHWTGNEGGRIGSDLSRSSATPEYLRNSMKNPNAQIDSTFQQVRIQAQDGRVLSGRRLHENAYFVLIMDQQENLLTIAKDDIEQISRPHQSLMPDFNAVLNAKDIEDLTTHVFSLKQQAPK